MLRLKKCDSPVTVSFFKGKVTMTLRPLTSDLCQEAQDFIAARLSDRADLEAMAEQAGEGGEGEIDSATIEVTQKLVRRMDRALIHVGLIEWTGVLDDDTGDPAPPEEAFIDMALDHPVIFQTLKAEYILPAWMLVAEKNG